MWHFNALWKVKYYSLNPRICIIHTFCFREWKGQGNSLCVPGKMCETLVSVQRELQPDWRNGTGLAQKAGALFSSAGIPLHSAPYCMCLRAKAGQIPALCWNLCAGSGTPGKMRSSVRLSLGCHMTAQDSSFKKGLQCRGFELGRAPYKLLGILEMTNSL